jgi:beta-mannanase
VLAATLCLASTASPGAASASIRLGVFNSGVPYSAQAAQLMSDYTAMVGRKPDIVMWYREFGQPLMYSNEVANLRASGQAPMISWEPSTQPLSQIAAGTYDSYLRDSARVAKSWGSELMIRFAYEMNLSWAPWGRGVNGNTASAYVAAWRHVVSVFRAEGVTNVRWVWAPNVDRNGTVPFSPYFPGDSYIDYAALDGYNWGATPGNRWTSVRETFASSYTTLTKLSAKPVIFSEIGSSEIGGDKAAWIRDGFLNDIPTYFPRVTAVVWFNKAKEDDWRINSTPASLDAYRAVVSSSLYGGSTPTASAPPVAAPPSRSGWHRTFGAHRRRSSDLIPACRRSGHAAYCPSRRHHSLHGAGKARWLGHAALSR